ncbi:hypothetical protein JCM9140_3126 [Halalkalibacter wakoensis JCM 9140]|uniref:DUF5067 domain-containing protein n=1 Tax=Halalkalibacter wakoensis JCM 9140 TaxID=1236970 RepID=W4Q4Z5_9BACI|nr:DUF5067 domain-containing protein [Halalkalibacter wakoensis]GAE27015.1 hypothetical protein JCM9140_3126 [Halalkalibacter wakoensis JCM 9140]
MKKVIYKKWWFWVVAFFVVLIIYGAITGVNQAKEGIANQEGTAPVETEQPEEVEQEPEEPETQEETLEKVIELDEQLLFGEFTVNMNQVHVYEAEDNIFAEVSFNWLNQAADGKKMFMSITLLSVYQGENDLEETTGAWDVENRNRSDVYFPNAENGAHKVSLTYKLENKEDPLELVFTPLNEFDEERQEITINID